MRMRWGLSVALTLGVMAASSCAISPRAIETEFSSSVVSMSTATNPVAPTLRVTVPALPPGTGESPTVGTPESSVVESSQTVISADPTPSSSIEPSTTAPTFSSVAATTPAPVVPTAPAPVPEPAPEPAPVPVPVPAPVPAPQPGTGVAVELVDCPGCSVIATRATVRGDLSAALISREGRVALLSVAADGAVRGAINVPYGSAFPAPADGVLSCDATSRCVLTAYQPDGTAIMSAFELTSTGAWRDISGDGAFPSATSQGAAVQLAAGLGIAVQVSDGATLAWMVLGWTGDYYTTAGCAADGPVPSAAQLDPAKCLS